MRAMKPRARHRRPSRHRLAALVAVAGVAVAGAAATGSHTVAPGETLSEIAADHQVGTQELAEANDIDNVDRLQAGQVLVMPGDKAPKDKAPGDKADKPTAPADTPAEPETRFHTVVAGETLWGIARRYGVTVAALAESNGIADVHRIEVGDRLAIDGPAPSAAQATTARAGDGGIDTSRFPARLQASPERLALIPTFERWAGEYDVPLDLLMAMTWLESGWQADVVSSAGAMGIGQIMPDTLTWMEDILIGEPLDPFSANDSIRMASRYLRWLLDRTGGDAATALAGYYQGLGAVQTSGIFPSTKTYVANVLTFRDQYFSA